jgi:hypothetical protein
MGRGSNLGPPLFTLNVEFLTTKELDKKNHIMYWSNVFINLIDNDYSLTVIMLPS